MRFAYADPPYYGCARLYTRHHPEARVWDTQEAHLDLVAQSLLCGHSEAEEDGTMSVGSSNGWPDVGHRATKRPEAAQ